MKIAYMVLLVLVLAACGEGKQPVQGETEFQRSMNANFKDATVSPLKTKDRKQFKGLDFFKFDSAYVVTAQLNRTPYTEWFQMKTTTNQVSEERVYGILTFELNGESHELSVYQGKETMQTDGMEDYLFLPFLDDTNGETTYGGGRYIDLRIPKGDSIIIDFNKAYNPYCAYNENYSCPIVPRENYLPLAIEAGVKAFKTNTLFDEK